MLTIINDPSGATGWNRLNWDCSISIQQNIERHISSGEGCTVRLNGLPIDPASDPVMDTRPNQDDEMMILKRPAADPVTWAIIIVSAAIVVSVALKPNINPNLSGSGAKDSPNNRLTAQTNSARAYQGIPDVYGYRRVWPDLVQPSVIEYIDNVKYVTELMCISRGEGVVSDVRYSDSALVVGGGGTNFEVFSPQAGAGYAEERQTIVPDVIESFSVPDVDGQEITPAAAFQSITLNAPTFNFQPSSMTITTTYQSLVDQIVTVNQLQAGQIFDITNNYSTGSVEPVTRSAALTSISISSGVVTMVFAATSFGRQDQPSSTAINYAGGVPTTIVGPFSTTADADILRWNIVFLRGLKGSAQIRTVFWKIDGSGNEVSGTRQTVDMTYSGDTFDARYYTEDMTPTGGNGLYRVYFQRLNSENGDGTDVAKIESLAAMQSYATKSFPGVTMIRVTTKATEAATSFRDRKINLRWQRLVRGLSTESVSASKNFARAVIHLWAISGRNVDQLDTDSLALINGSLGEDHPLLQFNGSFDDADMSLGERIRLIADHARCLVWRDGKKWTFVRDEARQFPDIQFDYLNMAPAEPSMSYSAHLPSTNDGVEVEYVDPTTQAKKAYVRLNIESGSPVSGASSNPAKVKLPGCTSFDQAENRAKLEAMRLLYQRKSLKFEALGDAMDLGPGALIRWVDPDDFYADDKLQAGEVLSISGNLIKTSESLRWDNHTQGRILFTNTAGRYIGSPVLCEPSDDGVLVASLPAGVFTAAGTQQLGSRYLFAVGVTDAELESASLWTVTEIKPNSSGTVSVSCVSYDEKIYSDDA